MSIILNKKSKSRHFQNVFHFGLLGLALLELKEIYLFIDKKGKLTQRLCHEI